MPRGIGSGDHRFILVEMGNKCIEPFLIGGWDLLRPGWHCLHEPHQICNQSVGLGFPHFSGAVHTGGIFACIASVLKCV